MYLCSALTERRYRYACDTCSVYQGSDWGREEVVLCLGTSRGGVRLSSHVVHNKLQDYLTPLSLFIAAVTYHIHSGVSRRPPP